MNRDELLNRFNELLETYGKHKAYADKAREQSASFSSAVIEKVIADHQIKSSLIADDIQPLVPKLQSEVSELTAAIGEAEQSMGDLGARIEELELRRAIGEISSEEFDELSADGKVTVDDANSQISSLAEARDDIQSVLDRWADLSGEAIDAQPIAAVAEEVDAEVLVDGADAADDFDPVVDSILPGFEEEGEDDHGEEPAAEAEVAFDVQADAEESVDVLPIDGAGVAPVEVAIDDSEVGEIGVDASDDGVR